MTTSAALASASTPSPKTYLQLCEEELNPDLLTSFSRESMLWNAAAIGTIVVFGATMFAALAVAALYAPLFVPIAGITSLLLLGQIKKVYALFEQRSEQASERANQLSAINKHFQALQGYNPAQIQEILRQKGIVRVSGMQQNDPHLTTLKPLIARHLFWEEHVVELDKKKQEKFELATKLSNDNFKENRDEICELRSEALELEKLALESKTKNAFINAVIQRPNFIGTLEDLGTFSALSGKERAIAMQTGAPKANDFFSFQARIGLDMGSRLGDPVVASYHAPTIPYNVVKESQIPDLAMRFFVAMPS